MTMSAPFLTLLNNVTLIPVLSEWISLIDLTFLDTSLTSRSSRVLFCILISSEMFTHVGSLEYKTERLFRWLILKNIRVRNINLSLYVHRPLHSKFLEYLKRFKNVNIEMPYCASLIRILRIYTGSISELSLSDSHTLDDESWLEILPYIKDISKLKICNAKITNASILKIIENCPYITSIETPGCDKLTSDILVPITEAFATQLSTLNLYTVLQSEQVSKALESCSNLKHLDLYANEISNCFNSVRCLHLISLDVGGSKLTETDLFLVATKFKLIRTLRIDSIVDVSDEVLFKIADNCLQLRVLFVDECSKITNQGMIKISEKCLKLEDISYRFCPQLTNETINAIYKNCKCIHLIDYREYGDQSLGDISSFAAILNIDALDVDVGEPNVVPLELVILAATKSQTLVLHGCASEISQIKLLEIIIVAPILKKISLLSATEYTNEVIDTIIECCPLVDSITLLNNGSIDGLAMLRFVEHYNSQLRIFKVENISNLQEEILLKLIPHLNNVTHLSIKENNYMSDDTLMLLIDSCPKITQLGLQGNVQLTDKSIKYTMESIGHQMFALNLSKCPLMTEKSIDSILSLCSKLYHLNIQKCAGLVDPTKLLMMILHNLPDIVEIWYGDDVKYNPYQVQL